MVQIVAIPFIAAQDFLLLRGQQAKQHETVPRQESVLILLTSILDPLMANLSFIIVLSGNRVGSIFARNLRYRVDRCSIRWTKRDKCAVG